jgi:hypothetical protein
MQAEHLMLKGITYYGFRNRAYGRDTEWRNR